MNRMIPAGLDGKGQNSGMIRMNRMEDRTTEEGKRQKLRVKRGLKSNTLCDTIGCIP